MPNSIYFYQKGTKTSQFATDCEIENFKYKNWMCNTQTQEDKIRERVLVKISLNKMLI